jgi:hypothetical protein
MAWNELDPSGNYFICFRLVRQEEVQAVPENHEQEVGGQPRRSAGREPTRHRTRPAGRTRERRSRDVPPVRWPHSRTTRGIPTSNPQRTIRRLLQVDHLGMADQDNLLWRLGKEPNEAGELLFVWTGRCDHDSRCWLVRFRRRREFLCLTRRALYPRPEHPPSRSGAWVHQAIQAASLTRPASAP